MAQAQKKRKVYMLSDYRSRLMVSPEIALVQRVIDAMRNIGADNETIEAAAVAGVKCGLGKLLSKPLNQKGTAHGKLLSFPRTCATAKVAIHRG